MIEYNNIAETFEENGPPILTFANTETFDGTSTEPLLALYEQTVNGAVTTEGRRKLAMRRYNSTHLPFTSYNSEEEESEEAVLLAAYDYEISSTLTVEEAMEEAAVFMHELAEEAEHGELVLPTELSYRRSDAFLRKLNSEEEGEEMEAFAGFYIYNMDTTNN